MKALFLKYLYEIKTSYWFVPMLLTLGAILLSFFTLELDRNLDSNWAEGISWIYFNNADGARALLSTVAGSMITVAGVTFSLTLLAVSHTTSQFGPRLLTNFMRDQGNQITLGTFLATFLYPLLILRTVRTAEEAAQDVDPATVDLFGPFVPHLSITVALGLTIASVGVLIYFFHHVPETMNLSNVVSGLGNELISSADEMFPEMIGEASPGEPDAAGDNFPTDDPGRPIAIGENRKGYLQAMDEVGLLELASQHELVVRLHCRPGEFLFQGATAFTIWPADKVDEGLESEFRNCLAFGITRTPTQNLLFVVDQLVEIAARALSPGVNDPFTAIICLHWMGNALTVIGGRNDPDRFRYDKDGNLRIIATPVTFREVADTTFDQLCPYFASDRNAALGMMQTIRTVHDRLENDARRELMQEHARELLKKFQLKPVTDDDLNHLRLVAGTLLD